MMTFGEQADVRRCEEQEGNTMVYVYKRITTITTQGTRRTRRRRDTEKYDDNEVGAEKKGGLAQNGAKLKT